MKYVGAVLMALVWGLVVWHACTPRPVYSDHLYPPLLPGLCGQDVSVCPTPLIKKAQANKVVTYRLDAGTVVYPGFRQQAADVANVWLDAVGVEGREVTSGVPDIWLTFPDDATFLRICGNGAAACIQYWADPVMIFFRRALLYGDWKTAISHEGINGGHALGLHERYDDRNFRCIVFPQPSTVMSCGSGIWVPTAFDVEWTCAVLKTSWCGNPPPPPLEEWGACEQYQDETWGCWNNYGGYWQRTFFEPTTYRWRPDDPVWRCVSLCP